MEVESLGSLNSYPWLFSICWDEQNLWQELAELGFLLSWMAGAQWPGENRQQRNG